MTTTMTNNEIISMAREAGLLADDEAWVSLHQEAMERFAALVAAHERERAWTEKDWDEAAEWIRQQEREACAKVCDERGFDPYTEQQCAAAIRARGEK